MRCQSSWNAPFHHFAGSATIKLALRSASSGKTPFALSGLDQSWFPKTNTRSTWRPSGALSPGKTRNQASDTAMSSPPSPQCAMSPAMTTASAPLSRNHANAFSSVSVVYDGWRRFPPLSSAMWTSERSPNVSAGFPAENAPGSAANMRRGPSARAPVSPPMKNLLDM